MLFTFFFLWLIRVCSTHYPNGFVTIKPLKYLSNQNLTRNSIKLWMGKIILIHIAFISPGLSMSLNLMDNDSIWLYKVLPTMDSG